MAIEYIAITIYWKSVAQSLIKRQATLKKPCRKYSELIVYTEGHSVGLEYEFQWKRTSLASRIKYISIRSFKNKIKVTKSSTGCGNDKWQWGF